MNIRHATIKDLPSIVDIYNSTIPGRMVTADTEPVTVEDKSAWFRNHSMEKRPLWVVEENGQLIGWVSFRDFYGRPAYQSAAEISIYLEPSQRGKQYGKKILDYAISKCPSLGIRNLLGFIFSHNIPSVRLFENAGFSKWGELPDVAVMDGRSYSLSIYGLAVA